MISPIQTTMCLSPVQRTQLGSLSVSSTISGPQIRTTRTNWRHCSWEMTQVSVTCIMSLLLIGTTVSLREEVRILIHVTRKRSKNNSRNRLRKNMMVRLMRRRKVVVPHIRDQLQKVNHQTGSIKSLLLHLINRISQRKSQQVFQSVKEGFQ